MSTPELEKIIEEKLQTQNKFTLFEITKTYRDKTQDTTPHKTLKEKSLEILNNHKGRFQILHTPPYRTFIPTQDMQTPNSKSICLVFSDVSGNNNKVWKGTITDKGVQVEWGRIGKKMQSAFYPNASETFLRTKEREKLNKGYTHAKIVESTSTISHNSNLKEIAVEQIAKGDTTIKNFVETLVNANIHTITSNSQITFNSQTGVFQTPLGVVTQEAIQEAKTALNEIYTHFTQNTLDASHTQVNQYLRLIPQDVGMKLDVKKLFPDEKAFEKQRDLLDALESSLKMLASVTRTDTAKPENLFEVKLALADKKTTERIQKLFEKTRHKAHTLVYNKKVNRVFLVEMPVQKTSFEKKSEKMDNIWELWHGTKTANILNILRVGLQMSPPNTAAIAGKMFGNGIYFSKTSTKSLNYTTNYWHGGKKDTEKTCYMFLCDVAMGNFAVPTGPTSQPPKKGFHSYFAQPQKSGVLNDECIIFSNDQFNIKYLVEFH
jgi:poly [ADP-ribose] polymerase